MPSPKASLAAGHAANPVRQALLRRAPDFITVGIFSALINVLTLTGSLYMLQVYDRVLGSHSVETLVLLSLIALAAFSLQGWLDGLRNRILGRIGAQTDADLSALAFRAATRMPLGGANAAASGAPLRDLDQLRAFLAGPGPAAMLDLPFTPIFLAACWLLHPALGIFAIASGLLLIVMVLYAEFRTRRAVRAANAGGIERQALSDSARRQVEAIEAMGMLDTLERRWAERSATFHAASLKATDRQAGLTATAKVVRVAMQSAILGLGAYLVIQGALSGGAMIAASILTARTLAPIESVIANWKGFIAARDSYRRLCVALPLAMVPKVMALPRPQQRLNAERLAVFAPGATTPILTNVTFELRAGEGLGIIGPSGAGKTALARALVGVWAAGAGSVRLDGADLQHWERSQLGRHIGYLPQDLGLADATVRDTIARHDPKATPEAVVRAAEIAGAHEMILSLAEGYETRVGECGHILSGGQRQRLGLARALYGEPFLVVLDEPNANLDSDGDVALTRAIAAVRARGGIVVVVTHRPAGLASVDNVAYLADRTVKLFGPKRDVLAALATPGTLVSAPATQGASHV